MKINHGLYNEQNEKRLRTNSNSKKIRVKKRRKLFSVQLSQWKKRASIGLSYIYLRFELLC